MINLINLVFSRKCGCISSSYSTGFFDDFTVTVRNFAMCSEKLFAFLTIEFYQS